MNRVVITGLGAVTPIGNNVNDFWKNIKKGTVGIDRITHFDPTGFPSQVAGEVKNFKAKEHMNAKDARRMNDFSQFSVAAALEALEDGHFNLEDTDPYRAGVIIGCGVGSMLEIEENAYRLRDKGPTKIKPLMVPRLISNMSSGNVSIQTGFKGKCISLTSACASGTHAIGEAFRSLKYGESDVMLAGGTEAAISPTGVAGFSGISALSTTEDPLAASIPFDKNRNGFVIGEGAGILLMETLDHALARGAKIYAELVGYGATADAYHITSPLEDGSGAAKAMTLALDEAHLTPESVDYLNAHGTSTVYNDLYETAAIKKAFGPAAYTLKINSTKSMIGHLLGAAGGVEMVVCVKSIEEDFIHQTVGVKEQDPACDLNYMIEGSESTKVSVAMSDSLGFGGHNAALVIQKYCD